MERGWVLVVGAMCFVNLNTSNVVADFFWVDCIFLIFESLVFKASGRVLINDCANPTEQHHQTTSRQ